ncbi:hypothetical protein [Sulfitobacter sp. R18_1]|uniref:hypothetical protein n=1 Tax=Sulfitobacter sp. R18_1 TaxID=2821104 RepID=UPI001ADA9B56|nr:hypothetical protein [Sulfitobacter sp. R18_1]MBO9428503.1 hypothetical protein [Sulfitobacter sp. R18_1]
MITFQKRVFDWAMSCLGKNIATDPEERACRFFEEACELAQASGLTKEKSETILEHVFSREIGDIEQEVGCVAVTLGVLCEARGIDMLKCAEEEYMRISAAPEEINAKHYTKPVEIRGE